VSAALEAALAGAAAACERSAAAGREAPVDPAVRVALAEAAASAPSAAERAIGERIERGLLDGDEVWRDPHALGPDGVRLVQRAVVAAAREIGRALP